MQDADTSPQGKSNFSCCFPSRDAVVVTHVTALPDDRSQLTDNSLTARQFLTKSLQNLSYRVKRLFSSDRHLNEDKSEERDTLLGAEAASQSESGSQADQDADSHALHCTIGSSSSSSGGENHWEEDVCGMLAYNSPNSSEFSELIYSSAGRATRISYSLPVTGLHRPPSVFSLELPVPVHMASENDTGMPDSPKEMAWTGHTPPSEFICNRDESALWRQMLLMSHERLTESLLKIQAYYDFTCSKGDSLPVEGDLTGCCSNCGFGGESCICSGKGSIPSRKSR